MITFKIAIRNVFRHRTRSIITLSAIAFGCTAIIFVGGFFDDCLLKLRESYIKAHTGHLQVFRSGFFEKGSARPFDYLIDHPQEIISLIDRVKGVRFVTQRLEFSGLISTGENTISFIGQGVEPKNEILYIMPKELRKENDKFNFWELKRGYKETKSNEGGAGGSIVQGEPLIETDTYSAILGQGLALNVGVQPGDGVILLTNTVGGSINALDIIVKGKFTTSSKAFDDRFLRMPLPITQKLLRTESIQSLMIILDKTEDTRSVKKQLRQLFKKNNLDLEVKTWEELSDFYTKTAELFNRQFLILKLVIAIVVILSIFNTMNMAVLERTNEIGTIRALGTRKRSVLGLFLCEGLMLGLLGGIIGVISGTIITVLSGFIGIPMPAAPGTTMIWLSEPRVTISAIIFAFLLSLISSLISSFYPAYKASKLEIAEALRYAA